MSSAKFTQRVLVVSGLMLLLLFALAYWRPLHFWGINFHSYLSIWTSLGCLVAGLAFAKATTRIAPSLEQRIGIPNWAVALGIACVMALLYYKLTIATQLYGDARSVLASLSPGGVESGRHSLWSALSPNIFSSKNGENFSYGLASAVQKALGGSISEAFRVLTALIGGIFAWVWMLFVYYKLKSPLLRLLGAILGLTAGAAQVFYGHAEVYAAPILLFTAYLITLVIYLEKKEAKWLIFLCMLLLLAIRSHAAGYILAPTLGYALFAHWAGTPERLHWLSWRRAGLMIPLICILLGVIVYFTAFSAGADKAGAVGGEKNIFLKLFADHTADNAYAMFSGWHFWDCWQELLLCTAPGFALLLAWAVGLARKQPWNAPAEVAVAIAVGLTGLLFFAIDPLLAMPRDWDLCALQAPGLLVLAVLWLSRQEDSLKMAWLPVGILIALGGLQAMAVVVNHDPHAVHLRQIKVAQHIVISGHGGGAFILRQTLELPAFTRLEALHLIDAFLKAVSPYQNKQNRSEFAFMYQFAGSLSYEAGDAVKALAYFKESIALEPAEIKVYEDMAVIEYQLKSYADALTHLQLAMAIDQNNPQDWLLGYTIARDQGNYQLALQFGVSYLARWPDTVNLATELEMVRTLAGQEMRFAPKSPSK